jgi:uncharacterized protein YecT (DUF1311 family)
MPFRSLYIAALVAACMSTATAAGLSALASCQKQAKNQVEINQCGAGNQQVAERELNAAYQAVLKKMAADKVFLVKFRAAQRAWLKWRDAEMAAIYPADNPQSEYGSVFPMCWSAQLAELDRERTRQLRRWIDGVAEGDVCAGSVPIR